jgi:hypothetical protein
MNRGRRIIRAVLVATVAGLVLAACVPKTSPPPPPAVDCSNVSASPYTYSEVVENCHNKYRTYKLDKANASAGNKALSLANSLSSCSSLSNSSHTPGATLLAQYPGSTSVGENLYCWQGSACPPIANAASSAMNAWIKSTGHKANLDNFAGAWVNAAATCNTAKRMYVAVAQFHKP